MKQSSQTFQVSDFFTGSSIHSGAESEIYSLEC